MNALFSAPYYVVMVLSLLVFAIEAFAFVDAVTHQPRAFEAADKLTKPAWLIFLGIALVWHMVNWGVFDLINMLGVVAALVYVLDVRPALRSLTGR